MAGPTVGVLRYHKRRSKHRNQTQSLPMRTWEVSPGPTQPAFAPVETQARLTLSYYPKSHPDKVRRLRRGVMPCQITRWQARGPVSAGYFFGALIP